MDRQRRATLYALGAVLAWSTVAAAFKLSLRELTPLQLLFFAATASVLALLAVVFFQGKADRLRRVGLRGLARAAWLGALNPFLYYVVLFRAYDLLPAQAAQPLNYTWPIALALLASPLLGQRLEARALGAIGVSFLGVALIATRGDFTGLQLAEPTGVLLALGSGAVWALFWLVSVRPPQTGTDPTVALLLNFAFGWVYIALAMLLLGEFAWPSQAGLLGAAYVGVFEMGLTFVLWSRALALAPSAARVGQLVYLSPFLSLVWIHWVVGEPIFPATVPGLVLIVGGIALQRRAREAGA